MIKQDRTSRSPLAQAGRRRRVGVKPAGARPRSARSLTPAEETTLRRILAKEQDHIHSDEFLRDDAEKRIYEEAPDIQKPDTTWYQPVMDDLSRGERNRAASNSQVLLSAAQERVLFFQFNYARFRIRKIQDEIAASLDRTPTLDQAREILRWNDVAERLREQIANTNLALVLAMAKRTRLSEVDFAEMVSEGNMALLRAVDKFDAERGFKFSTYACRAILKAFSRQGMKQTKHRQRFPAEYDPKLQRSDYVESKRLERVRDDAAELRRIVLENTAALSDIERTVIEHRFGIETPLENDKPLTLEQIGKLIGVTKERVRQIQNKALAKLREEIEETDESDSDGGPTDSAATTDTPKTAAEKIKDDFVTGFGLN